MTTTVENEVGLKLRGSPRWWTITDDGGACEVVRVVLRAGVHYSAGELRELLPVGGVVESEMPIYAVLQPGQYKWPPLAGPLLAMGQPGWDVIKSGGGVVTLSCQTGGKKLEGVLLNAEPWDQS